jgi:hypothetical protein
VVFPLRADQQPADAGGAHFAEGDFFVGGLNPVRRPAGMIGAFEFAGPMSWSI